MCGRFTITVTLDELKEYLTDYYEIEDAKSDFNVPRYNVAPGQEIISIINDGKKNRVGYLKWGFIPPFAKDEKTPYQTINAKAETLKDKSAFKSSFEHKRCVVLADGFYEWKKEKDRKQPMRILMKEEKIFPIAGLYSTFTRPDGSKLHTATLITTSANDLMKDIHERMPVILSDDDLKVWLDPKNRDLDELSQLLKPYDAKVMKSYEVSPLVNNVAYDEPECILKR